MATLVRNDSDVLLSTLSIKVLSVTPSGFVTCIQDNGNEDRINFAVIGEFNLLQTSIRYTTFTSFMILSRPTHGATRCCHISTRACQEHVCNNLCAAKSY